jgi:hypothetical protein
MSVTTELSQIKYAGRGDTGPYVITFPVTYNDIGNAEYIKVYVLDKATGVKTDITSTSSIDGLNVTTAIVYDSNYEIQILRDPPFTQKMTLPTVHRSRRLYLIRRWTSSRCLRSV